MAAGGQVLNVLNVKDEYERQREAGASVPEAAARAGASLMKPTEYGALSEYENMRQSGHSKAESTASAVAGYASDKLVSGGPVDTAINLTNAAATRLGAPQGVTDVTSIAASATPTSMISGGVKAFGRTAANLVTGDWKAMDKQAQEMREGKAGAAIQGYAQTAEVIVNLATGDNFEQALMKASAAGKGSSAERVGSFLGDVAFADVTAAKSMIKEIKEGKDFETVVTDAGKAMDEAMGKDFVLKRAGDAIGDWVFAQLHPGE
jgi:hypothetical protein